MKLIFVISIVANTLNRSNACSSSNPQACINKQACISVSGVWITVDPATFIPGTALVGGRRYTLTQTDNDFSTTISAPHGGYCTIASQIPPASPECEADAESCSSMDACFYRKSGSGRWFHTDASSYCMSNCSHPLVFCNKGNCQTTMGCSWFVLSQANADQCYCIDNPGIFGNPPPKTKLSWIFWDQPISMPVFVIAVIAAIGLLYKIFVTNVKPFFDKLLFKKKPKQ